MKKINIGKSFTKLLLSIIFVLLSIIYIKVGNTNNYEKIFINNSLIFTKANNLYNKYMGSNLPIDINIKEKETISEDLEYYTIDKYLNGSILTVSNNYIVPSLSSGIIVYIGEKEGYNNTIIVQGNDNVDIWYGNIDTTNLNMYDYVKKGEMLASVKDNTLYLVFLKDNNYLSYEEYQS